MTTPSILNITNGDCAVTIMQKAGLPGDYLPWRDVLHDGPVPDKLSLAALSQVRAKYIASRNWGKLEDLRKDFIQRDETLFSSTKYDKIILWFEHDLYDQLQLLQILDWFNQHHPQITKLCLICTEQYLGRLTPEQMANMIHFEQPVSVAQLMLATKAWAAFRSDSPLEWQSLLKQDTTALPFLKDAVMRQLEEYPSRENGLSRTAWHALRIISIGPSLAGTVFGDYAKTEEKQFLGDSSFAIILQDMLASSPALIKLSSNSDDAQLSFPNKSKQTITITEAGLEALFGQRHFLDCTAIDCWIGGVHIQDNAPWCWDSELATISQSPITLTIQPATIQSPNCRPMKVDRIAAFSKHKLGGNPAGVVICKKMPSEEDMLATAARVGYSETAFLVQKDNDWRIRYFAPQMEIPFCGHATIASGAALGKLKGVGDYRLILNEGSIKIKVSPAKSEFGLFAVTLTSPPTHTEEAPLDYINSVLTAFNLSREQLNPHFPIRYAFAGAKHLILFLKDRQALADMSYEFEHLKQLMQQESVITVSLLWAEHNHNGNGSTLTGEQTIHARNPFAIGGVYEDPATGAAAAALGGYLRDIGWPAQQFTILQGEDMGVPSRLSASFSASTGEGVNVTGDTRQIDESEWQ